MNERSGQLSERQRQLLELVVAGTRSSKALAQKTGIATGTIDNLLQQAAKTLGVTGRDAAARRFAELEQNSHDLSHVRKLSFPTQSKMGLFRIASITWRIAKAIADFLRGPPLGGTEHSLRWDQITLLILRVAFISMITVTVLVLLVLGFFKTFG